MEIIRIVSNQVVLMPYDHIPLQRLFSQRASLANLARLFEFSQFELVGDETGNRAVSCQSGNFGDDTGSYPIVRLIIEERRILLGMEAPSDISDRVIDKIREYLASLAATKTDMLLVPLLQSYESEMIVKLAFDADRLVPQSLRQLATENILPAAALPMTHATIALDSIQFQLSYTATDPLINQTGISLSKKVFTIGPRPSVPLSERVYYSKGPFVTDAHIHALQTLENLLA